jgi:hypothetical protein
MIIDLSKLTPSDYAAWWGAIIATLALIWNIIIALRSGPRIKVTASPNMKVYPQQPITEDNTYISVRAINRGTSPTTITHFAGFYAPNLWALLRGKKQHFVVNTHPVLGNPIPFVLKPGEEWSSLADQNDLTEKSEQGYLYLGVYHNQGKRPIFKRVKFNA